MSIKTFRFLFFFTTMISMVFMQAQPVFAQEVSDDQVSFSQLDTPDITLKGPLNSGSVRFTLPADWRLTSDAELHLNMHVFAAEADTSAPGSVKPISGFLSIRVNDIWIQTITLDRQGDYSLEIPIPASAWITEPRNARQTLRFSLESAQNCDMIMAALARGILTGLNVQIQASSHLVLPHQTSEIPLDFKLMPYPIYQRTFQPEQAILVMPTTPSESELQAVLIAAGAFGSLTQKALPMTFLTVDQVQPALLEKNQVIFVGKAESLPLLTEAKWPLPIVNGKINSKSVMDNDGILQLAVSPYNASKAWLWVGGNTETGIIKAAQALGDKIRPAGRSDLAIVAEVTPKDILAEKSDFTLEELGYQSQTFTGINDFSAFYWIDVPLDYEVSNGAYLDIVYTNSALLNFDDASLTLKLNSQFVGGLRFNDRSTSASSFRFNIPAYMFRSGSNQMVVNVSLKSATPCTSNNDVWATIGGNSKLHIPVEPATAEPYGEAQLTAYPKNIFPLFGHLTVMLAEKDPMSWRAAAQIFYELGKERRGSVINPTVIFPSGLTTGLQANNDFLLVGQATTLPILQQLTNVLPAPFADGSNIATERDALISFRVPVEEPVGYLQILQSPWNPRRNILLVAGNGDEGLSSAVAALTDSDRLIYPSPSGNLTIVTNLQVISQLVNIHSAQQTLSLAPTPIPALDDTEAPPKNEISINLVTVGVILVIAVLALALIYWLARRRAAK